MFLVLLLIFNNISRILLFIACIACTNRERERHGEERIAIYWGAKYRHITMHILCCKMKDMNLMKHVTMTTDTVKLLLFFSFCLLCLHLCSIVLCARVYRRLIWRLSIYTYIPCICIVLWCEPLSGCVFSLLFIYFGLVWEEIATMRMENNGK